jgi:peptide/nickel transport system substrate-binding protein
VLATTLLAACGGPSSASTTSSRPPAGGTVTQRLAGDFDQFDFVHGTTGTPAYQVVSSLYDRMVAVDAKGNLIPYLARSWKTTPTSVAFTLRTDATCSDGTPVTPTVVAGSFNQSFQNSNTKRLVGSQTATATSDEANHTVTVTVPNPFSELVYGFVDPYLSVVCPAGLAPNADLKDRAYGSGPFTLESAVHGDAATLKVRPDWKWGPNGTTAKTPGFPGTLVYKVVSNDTTAANLLVTGGLDVGLVTGPDVQRLQGDRSLTNRSSHSYYTYPMYMNHDAGRPASDPALRQALMTAIDPKAFNQAAYSGLGTVSSSFLTPDAQCYDPNTTKLAPSPSVGKARSILSSAGYTTDSSGRLMKGGQPITLKVLGFPQLQSGPEYVLNQLQQLGIAASLVDADFQTYVVQSRAQNWDVTWGYIPSAFPVAAFNIVFISGPSFLKPPGQNRSTIYDPVVDQAVAQSLSTTGAAQCKALATAQEEMLKGSHMLPLSAPDDEWFGKKVDFIPGSPLVYAWTLRRS